MNRKTENKAVKYNSDFQEQTRQTITYQHFLAPTISSKKSKKANMNKNII
jgi:hypothetical protein